MRSTFIRRALRGMLGIALPRLLSAQTVGDSAYHAERLALKQRFGEAQRVALSSPFIGLRSGERPIPGLFSVRSTGVSTKPIIQAAQSYLGTLTGLQRLRTQYAVDDDEWRMWSNVDNGIYGRQGVSLREMSSRQKAAAWGLMRATLSARGLATSQAIMKTDRALREINKDSLSFDEELYFLTIMGQPSATEPWGWQLDGHHLVINFFVLGDQVVMTPVFMGAEPAVIASGKYAGTRVLQTEQDAGLAFFRMLDGAQRQAATLSGRKVTNSIEAQANRDNHVLKTVGIPGARLNAPQRTALLSLIAQYVGNLREGHARVRMDEVRAHLDSTYFAWIGGTSDTSVFYYRVHGPVILVEFDHQVAVGTSAINRGDTPVRAHIHTVVRTPNGNDYGKDLLGQHLKRHKH